jgi:hypothetical protein
MEKPHSKAQLLSQIAKIERMEPGKLSDYHLKDRPGKSGPYYKLQHHENGKNRTQYVRPEQVADVQAAIDGYKNFEQLVSEYSQIVIQQTREERSSGIKKKRRNSSSPRTRKSKS